MGNTTAAVAYRSPSTLYLASIKEKTNSLGYPLQNNALCAHTLSRIAFRLVFIEYFLINMQIADGTRFYVKLGKGEAIIFITLLTCRRVTSAERDCSVICAVDLNWHSLVFLEYDN